MSLIRARKANKLICCRDSTEASGSDSLMSWLKSARKVSLSMVWSLRKGEVLVRRDSSRQA